MTLTTEEEGVALLCGSWLGGAKGEFDFDLHAMRRISYVGVTFRTRSVDEVREINRRMRADLWDAVEAGTLRLPNLHGVHGRVTGIDTEGLRAEGTPFPCALSASQLEDDLLDLERGQQKAAAYRGAIP